MSHLVVDTRPTPAFRSAFYKDKTKDFPTHFGNVLSLENGQYSWLNASKAEKLVLSTEAGRRGFLGSCRNPSSGKTDAIRIAYDRDSRYRHTHPDFIFFFERGDQVAPATIDHHGSQLSDSLPKLVGLANFAEAHHGVTACRWPLLGCAQGVTTGIRLTKGDDMTSYEWGPATVTYPDWQGTAQIDQKATGNIDMYSLANINRDEWTIIGLEWSGGESGWHDLNLIVVPHDTDLDADQIEATRILIHDVNPMDFMSKIMHVADFRFRSRRTADKTITVTALGDVPEQG